jgi:selenocysteine-specific elongation factor
MNTPITIGVAGHVDHGKTTLVKTLTGIDTDRRQEEKARGLSIDAGVAELKLPSGKSVALIDVPGHTDFLKNTIRGLNSVDLAVLVVAADDGVMPQTREHLEILKFFKAATGLVVISKVDLVDEETVEVAELELKELVQGTFLERCPIFRFTDRKPDLCNEILHGIGQTISDLPVKKPGLPLRMWIDQVKSITGHGTVVSGTITSGNICCNDEIELLPLGIRCRARSLEMHGCVSSQAVAGQRAGINLPRIPVNKVGRGMSLATPASIRPAAFLNAEISVLTTARQGIKNHQKVKIYIGTSITNAMIVLMQADRLEPGESGLVQLRLMKAVAALPQDAFVVSPLNLNIVIAGGRILETTQEKFRTIKAVTVLPFLRALHQADLEAYVEKVFDHNCGHLITAKTLCGRTGLPEASFERLINTQVQKGALVYFKGHGAIKKSHLSALEQAFKTTVEALFKKDPLKKNVALNEIAEQLEPVEEVLLTSIADRLCRSGFITRLEGGFILTRDDTSLDAHREALIAQLLDYAQSSGLTPFSADTFWKLHQKRYEKTEISQLLNFLFSRKKIVRLRDQRFLSLEALEVIKTRVAQAIASKGHIDVSDCKELLGYGRWGGIHVLDYLNEIGFTVRRSNKHYLE